jgi:hypothetical protein
VLNKGLAVKRSPSLRSHTFVYTINFGVIFFSEFEKTEGPNPKCLKRKKKKLAANYAENIYINILLNTILIYANKENKNPNTKAKKI